MQAALREVDRRVLLGWIANYRRQHERYDELWHDCEQPPRPTLFEVSFGRSVAGENAHSVEQPFELAAGNRVIRISGRIDRIDIGTIAGRVVFNVLDYKTGSPVRFNRESAVAGTTLQLPSYALAASELLLADRKALPGGPDTGICATAVSRSGVPCGCIAGVIAGWKWSPSGRTSATAWPIRWPRGPRDFAGTVRRVQCGRPLHGRLSVSHDLPRQPGPRFGQDIYARKGRRGEGRGTRDVGWRARPSDAGPPVLATIFSRVGDGGPATAPVPPYEYGRACEPGQKTQVIMSPESPPASGRKLTAQQQQAIHGCAVSIALSAVPAAARRSCLPNVFSLA